MSNHRRKKRGASGKKPGASGKKRGAGGKKPGASGKKPDAMQRLPLVACVILVWVAYRTIRNYREHGGWYPVDLISTAMGAVFGMLIGIGILWCKDRMDAQNRR